MIQILFIVLICLIGNTFAVAGCNAENPVSPADFKNLIQAIEGAPFSSQKVTVLGNFLKDSYYGFSGDQVAALLDSFPFSADRNKIIEMMTPWVLGLSCADVANVVDHQAFSSDKISTLRQIANLTIDIPEHNKTVIDAFTFSSDKKEAMKILEGARPISCTWGDVHFRKHIVFICDTSGSMSANMKTPSGAVMSRLRFVVEQLSDVLINTINPDQMFNLVRFSSSANAWKPGVVAVNSANVQSAVQFASQWSPGGSTNMLSSLNLAMADPNAQGIVLLSDGEPDGAQSTMLQNVAAWAAKGNIVNTVFVQSGGAANPAAAKFMCDLAKAGKGVCRTNN